MKNLPTRVFTSVWLIVGDLVLCGLLVGLAVWVVKRLCSAVKARRLRAHLLGPGIFINLATVLVGGGFAIFFTHLSISLEDLATKVANMPKVQSGVDPQSRRLSLNECYDDIILLAEKLRYCELATFWYSLILMSKFFHAFEGHPKLGSSQKPCEEPLSTSRTF